VNDISAEQLQGGLYVLSKSVPDRNAASDYFYGDAYELLALVSAQRDVLQSYCYNCNGPGCFPRMDSDICTNPSFEPKSAFLLMMDSYGLAGVVQHSLMDPNTGKFTTDSLLGDSDGGVSFCSAMPHSTGFYHNTYSYFGNFPDWLAAIKDAETGCDSHRQLSATRRTSERGQGGGLTGRPLGKSLSTSPKGFGLSSLIWDQEVRKLNKVCLLLRILLRMFLEEWPAHIPRFNYLKE
jgi:hypothetical protein